MKTIIARSLAVLVLGMLGELGARIYYAVQDRKPYAIRRAVNFDEPMTIPVVGHRRAA